MPRLHAVVTGTGIEQQHIACGRPCLRSSNAAVAPGEDSHEYSRFGPYYALAAAPARYPESEIAGVVAARIASIRCVWTPPRSFCMWCFGGRRREGPMRYFNPATATFGGSLTMSRNDR